MSTGRDDEGRALIDRSLAIRKGLLEPDDPELLYYRWLRENLQDEGIDETYRERAQAALEALSGRSDLSSRQRTVIVLLGLGSSAWQIDNDFVTMAECHERALALAEELEAETGQRLNETPDAIMLLGFNAIMRSDIERAEHFNRKSVSYTEEAWGKQHARYAQSMGQLATVLRDAGKLEEAESAALEALEVRKVAVGSETDNVVYDLAIVSSVYRARGDLERAERFARETLELSRRIESVMFGSNLCLLADVLVARGTLGETSDLLDEAKALEVEANACRRAEGLLELRRGNIEQGEAIAAAAYEELEQRDPLNFALAQLADEVEAQYRALGRSEDATRWAGR